MYGILIREGVGRGAWKNIGDYVQSIAQKQFLKDKETCFVEIEKLSEFKSEEPVNVIMNGWFMWHPEMFPPSPCINPLFISFHLTPSKEKDFFTPETIAYLKKYEPIGARDVRTANMMKAHGIDSYFSGCLTMTLGLDYKQDKEHDGDIFIVDPYMELFGDSDVHGLKRVWKYLGLVWHAIKYFRKVWKLKDKYINTTSSVFGRISLKLDEFICTADYYHIYSQRFSDEILLNAKYISAIVDNYMSNDEKFALADSNLRDYANAKCVITSRLHVSFPCLAVGTKNIFVIPSEKSEGEMKNYTGRVGELNDTVTIMELRDGKLQDKGTTLPEKITLANFPENKVGYRKYFDQLIKTVEKFISNNK